VLQNYCPVNTTLVAIREDLRREYGLPEIVAYASCSAYLLGVAAHTAETGLIALNAAGLDTITEELRTQYDAWYATIAG